MDQGRVWLAVFLSLGLFFAYDYFVIRPYREAAKQQAAQGLPDPRLPEPRQKEPAKAQGADLPPLSGSEAAEAKASARQSGTPIVVETDLFRATIDSLGGRLRVFELKRFRQQIDGDGHGLVLIDGDHLAVLPLTVELAGEGSDLTVEYSPNKTSFVISGDHEESVELSGVLPSGARVKKTLTFRGADYVFDVLVQADGQREPESIGLVMAPILNDSPHIVARGRDIGAEKAIAFAEGKLVEHQMADLESASISTPGALWAGFASRYFVSLVVCEQATKNAEMGPRSGVPVVRIDEQAENGTASFKVLIGPKEKEVLDAAGDHLDRALDFGWFWFIAVPLLYLLRIFDGVFGNYGVSIIVLTVLVKIVTIPLTRAQYRSMQKMQQIQPHLERLKERYKDDSAGMQREMMELYRKQGVNPFSGCVPMLLQIPIFVGLYNALLNAIELRHAPFVWWITDLSVPDRLMVGGIGIPVLVILMGASMLIQQWMTPMQGDPTQRRMMMFMPVIFTAMFLNFPSGLVLYWLVNNVISIVQQYFVMRGTKQGARA